MDAFLDVLAAVFLIIGCLLSLVAGIGLMTFPDLLTRLHAATKPQVLGFLLIFIALAIHLRSWAVVPVLALAWGMQLLTAPVSAHMIGRSGYRTKHVSHKSIYSDELAEAIRAVEAEQRHDQGPPPQQQ
ncbi:monovalent cation/H(+) antiporter subunit G [Glutamicibacter sp. PS]|uniref:monovalent cation/H(+) antiporter subunit G n=1 Tax=Glutamicibacter sp. PS TaxID=3075634 RepID=UPI0028452067|nr:monovalent cation/H(+) antiporter subunit G [Glutamicibacter sp. PS]MDR4532011.1 monovalent cation/H(+) antiporter subunit G [Glutamicibacter sp. PS]